VSRFAKFLVLKDIFKQFFPHTGLCQVSDANGMFAKTQSLGSKAPYSVTITTGSAAMAEDETPSGHLAAILVLPSFVVDLSQ